MPDAAKTYLFEHTKTKLLCDATITRSTALSKAEEGSLPKTPAVVVRLPCLFAHDKSMRMHKERFRRPQQAEGAGRVRPVFEDFHLLWMEGVYEYPRHQHTNYEVIMVERGPYCCELNGIELTLNQGQVLLIKPGDWHQDHLHNGQRHYVLHFRLASTETGLAAASLFSNSVSPNGQVSNGFHPNDTWILRELGEEARRAAIYAGAVQDGLLEAMFWRIVRGLSSEVLSPEFRQLPQTETRREEIAAVFSRFITKNPNMSELAGVLRISPRQLVNRCRELFGETPARLLLRFKLRRADELLSYRGLRVQEVSEELGFANPYHFSRVYRRLRGHAPTRRGVMLPPIHKNDVCRTDRRWNGI
jgi:AraC-like DNA-binding protein